MPEPVTVEPTVQEVKQRSYEDQLFCDRVREIASTGCPVEVAAKVLDLDIRVFTGLVETHFRKSWITLQQEAKLTTLVQLQVEALKQVAKGRDKLILLLDKHGLCPQFGQMREQAKGEGDFDPAHLSDAELTERLKAALQKRVPGWQLSPTLSIEEPKPGDGLVIGTRQSHGRDEYDLPELPTPAPSHESARPVEQVVPTKTFADQISEVVQPTEPEQKPVTAHTGVNQDGSPAGPVVARPKPGIHVLEDHIMNTERVGIIKKEMIESLR
ncbi:MAG: hypothetical protein WBE55_09350 [Candidatus Sulfotelmatobacter sp.]